MNQTTDVQEKTSDRQESQVWYTLEGDEVLKRLDSNRDGLSPEEARLRLEEFGPNRLPEEEKEGPLIRFLRQFHNVLIYILLVASVVTALLGHWIDTGVILAVVIVNAVIGFLQEGKAERALEGIRKMLSLHATVIRGGKRKEIEADELVPGDIVLLGSGDRVPADIRLLEQKSLRVEEAALTGESEPVKKSTGPVPKDTFLGDRSCMLFSSTLVSYGQGRGVVVATGRHTEIGKIGEMISAVKGLTTPLLRKIERFGHWLSMVIVLVGALTFLLAYLFREYALDELFLIVVGLAVASIPEGLPAIMTITLAIGVQRMAARNAIIRRLPAVETLGSVTVICSDKTGTLTRNEMTATTLVTARHAFEVTGSGYRPEGEFRLEGKVVALEDHPEILEFARAGYAASDSEIDQDEEGEWILEGEPTEGAVVTFGRKVGTERSRLDEEFPRLDVIPFESENRYMATLNRDAEGRRWIFLKGAPEKLLSLCRTQKCGEEEEPLEVFYWESRMEEIAANGSRLIAVALREVSSDRDEIEQSDVEEGGFVLLGMLGLIDPPRPEAVAAVEECREAGIRVKMITGDHALTARSIGAQLGIGDGEKYLTGRELEEMSDEELHKVVLDYDVFARTSPEHKLRLVTSLQGHGQTVAMTGDGVNDAPALKRADVGVAMGIKGSEATKDAAEMVLADDNFASIASAVREGRTIYDNLKKSILFILPTNGGEALVVLATVVFAFAQLPITPAQILWVNMITAVTLALALAFEPPERGVMSRPPRDPSEPILSGYLVWRVLFVSVLLALAVLYLFFRELNSGTSLAVAQTTAVNVLVVGEMLYLLNSRFIVRPSLTLDGLFGNLYAFGAVALVVIFQLIFTYTPPFQHWFGTGGLPLETWGWILMAAVVIFFLVEVEKAVMRRLANLDSTGQPRTG